MTRWHPPGTPDHRRAVITGVGPLSPVGIGVEAFWQGLRDCCSAVRRLDLFDTSAMQAKHAAVVEGFDPSAWFPSHRLKRLDRYAQFAVASAMLALRDSGLELDPEAPNERVGISFGTALGGISNAEEQHRNYMQRGHRGVARALALQVFGGSGHANIAIEFGIRGIATTNSNSCASSNVALGEAMRFIRDDLADVVIAGGSEAPLCPLTFVAFDNINTMSRWQGDPPSHACRPFDRARDGFVMAEGAASFVVESLAHARRRGAMIYAEIIGYSLGNEAYHMTTPRPDGKPLVRAMREAIDSAGIRPDEIDHVNPHASATQLNDLNEGEAMKRLFNSHIGKLSISATKAYIGHALGAGGALEAAATLLSMRRGWVPPVLHLENPDPDCNGALVRGDGREQEVHTALSNSLGFGGINSCLVFRRI